MSSKSLADNYRLYIIDGTVYMVARGKLWKRTGQTHNPRVIALADAVGSGDGELLTVHTDGPAIHLQHHISGIEKRLYAAEWTDFCYVTFEEMDRLFDPSDFSTATDGSDTVGDSEQ